MNSNLILMIGLGLGLLLLLIGIASSVFGRGSIVEERLGQYSETGQLSYGGEVSAEKERDRSTPVSDFFNRMGEGTDLFDGISKNLARADIKLRPAEYIAGIFICGVVVAALGFFATGQSIFLAIVFFFVGLLIPRFYVKLAQGRRLKSFDNQLSDMINLMVNGLRAGFSTLQAMESVSRELPSPISDEFRRVVQEVQLGLTIEDALEHLLRRISSDDLDLVITAINVQREVGGNLAEILDTISHTIRERVRIKGQIQALTAQGQATGWVIAALPFALAGILFLVNREYIMVLFAPETRGCGIPMVILAFLMIVFGMIAIQKIVNIDI
jgi:tight adherence protein B